ncbi:MAG: hypothetical protein KG003_09800 [Bacteroidetes bacterium]|nr:hypothetical protein [Bacteroidota bacterium]
MSISQILAQKHNYDKTLTPKIERKIAWPDSTVFLPYTTLCFIEKASLPQTYGWLMTSDILPSVSNSLLIMEMSSSDLLHEKYASGSLQIVFEIPDFTDSYQIQMPSWKISFRYINGYGSGTTPDPINGNLNLTRKNGGIALSGKLELTIPNQKTFQLLEFNKNLIPNLNLGTFLSERLKKKLEDSIRQSEMIQKYVDDIIQNPDLFTPFEEDTFPLNRSTMDSFHGFLFTYNQLGLGSNQFYPTHIKIIILDSILQYGLMRKTDEVEYIDFATGDTTWKERRKWHSIPTNGAFQDSILKIIHGFEGKYLFFDNTNVMSGGVSEYFIQYKHQCTSLSMKNVTPEIEVKLSKLLNFYLPESEHFYVGPDPFSDLGLKDSTTNSSPLVTECKGWSVKNKITYWGEEFEFIRANSENHR